MFLTESGKVFSCGWSADGQTGVGHYENVVKPTQILGDIKDEKIVKLACVADNVLALNGKCILKFARSNFINLLWFADKGEVFGWGNSEYGQFNMVTDEQQINSPIKLDLGEVGKVIDIATGGSICLVLNGKS